MNFAHAFGGTPLHAAVSHGPGTAMAKWLLASGAKINVRDRAGQTPLHRAAEVGRADLVILFLHSGADVTMKDKNNRTPVEVATEQRLEKIVDLLKQPPASLPPGKN